jgi:predicted AAA+ superfamily ATPase
MHPLTAQEIGNKLNMAEVLTYGLLPMAIGHSDPRRYLESYVQTYLYEEIPHKIFAKNPRLFVHFLKRVSLSQGKVINYSEIARVLSTTPLIVAKYFQILEDFLLATRINLFTKSDQKNITSPQKFYFFDTGVYKIVRPTGPLDTREESDGAALETLFFQSLSAVNHYFELGYTIYYWRTQAGNEVDFILYGPRGLHAFEIKRSSQVASKSLSGLKSFAQDYPEAKLHLVYLGQHAEYHGDITALPFEEALKNLFTILQ